MEKHERIDSFSVSAGEEVRLQFWKNPFGTTFLDIRRFIKEGVSDQGKAIATRKGVSVPADSIPRLQEALAKANEAFYKGAKKNG